MSPYVGKIGLIFFVVVISGALLIILRDLYAIKDKFFNTKLNFGGHIRQHGEYWVWHDFIRDSEELSGNESITLTTHGTYMDLALLPNLLTRWRAPISMSIYANGEDYQRTMESIAYLDVCMGLSLPIRRYLSIHIIMHSDHMPAVLRYRGKRPTISSVSCNVIEPFSRCCQHLTYWYNKQLPYPANLMRNVARMNARTYYVLAMDIQLLPTPKFVKKFLRFMWDHDWWRFADIPMPYTTVFCLPTFAHRPEAPLPLTKRQLVEVLGEFNITSPIYDSPQQQKLWLVAPNPREELFIFRRSTTMDMCVAYVSINELEPLYDERLQSESIYEHGANLKGQVLMSLNYTFITLDGAFLVRRTLDSWEHSELRQATFQSEILDMLETWKIFYQQLLKLVPEGFRERLYRRSYNFKRL
ncbi:beta-1,4-glucuronyltransferase 1-like [Scaptodrosophila lebanonensis]|uniref:Beta-1,4-glucuronyltransferase 1-like n=1 Tax=Drosophila lebanonensis TaxID=7225 RepID=A0A6J2TYR3_DROLE|nr:beta-1,4-glucuronyltransferase 1-like [Scaptodrosophila lebanonensis]